MNAGAVVSVDVKVLAPNATSVCAIADVPKKMTAQAASTTKLFTKLPDLSSAKVINKYFDDTSFILCRHNHLHSVNNCKCSPRNEESSTSI